MIPLTGDPYLLSVPYGEADYFQLEVGGTTLLEDALARTFALCDQGSVSEGFP